MRIDLQAITDRHEIKCPSCDADIYHLFPDSSAVPGGGYFITDGDSIPGVWRGLREDQKQRAYAHALEVGSCRQCGATYRFAISTFIDVANDDHRAEPYLHLNRELGMETNFLCHPVDGPAFLPEQWFMHEYATDIGPMHYHYVGPFKNEDESAIKTSVGVTSCGNADNTDPHDPWVHSSDVLLACWDSMLSLITKVNSERK